MSKTKPAKSKKEEALPIKKATLRAVESILRRLNKKPFGRDITIDELVKKSLNLLKGFAFSTAEKCHLFQSRPFGNEVQGLLQAARTCKQK